MKVLRVGVATAVLAVFAASGPGAGSACAQVMVTSQQNLVFGELVPGIPAVVAPTDVARRAALTISGRGRFTLSFQLPAMLGGPAGAEIPLVFSPDAGRVEIRHKIVPFDPSQVVTIHINPAEEYADVYVGAEARPATGQRPGTYTATIVMMVVQTGT